MLNIALNPDAFDSLKQALEGKKVPLQSAELSMVSDTMVPVNDVETAQRLLNMMEEFEDHDDVQEVYANFDIPDDILQKLQ